MSHATHHHIRQKLLNIASEHDFANLALEVFRHQAQHCEVYAQYLQYLHTKVHKISNISQIPCLPVELFKQHDIAQAAFGNIFPQSASFYSSGTGSSGNSRHFVADVSLYEASFEAGFRHFYGDISEWSVAALLPSYLERSGSSLVYMANKWLEQARSGAFFLYEWEQLKAFLLDNEQKGQKTLLLGVTFALLDFAQYCEKLPLRHTTIMETGGMKGRRRELLREEVHEMLKNAFEVAAIHSEYGMTELLSQAYSEGGGVFRCAPTMQVLCRDATDPFSYLRPAQSGLLNVIDLANLYSCSFLATADVGRVYADGSFEVLGRADHSDIRGCNLMLA
ncbi:MAG: acyl transferase [Sphingobacteriales bacterium]|nr:acyl transferase [Sphingobacteriales bacterium]